MVKLALAPLLQRDPGHDVAQNGQVTLRLQALYELILLLVMRFIRNFVRVLVAGDERFRLVSSMGIILHKLVLKNFNQLLSQTELTFTLELRVHLLQGFNHGNDQLQNVPQCHDACELPARRVVNEREGGVVLHDLALDHLLEGQFVVQNHDFAIVRKTVDYLVFFEEGADVLL